MLYMARRATCFFQPVLFLEPVKMFIYYNYLEKKSWSLNQRFSDHTVIYLVLCKSYVLKPYIGRTIQMIGKRMTRKQWNNWDMIFLGMAVQNAQI